MLINGWCHAVDAAVLWREMPPLFDIYLKFKVWFLIPLFLVDTEYSSQPREEPQGSAVLPEDFGLDDQPSCASFYRQPLKYLHLYVLCLTNHYEQVWYRTSGNRQTFCDGFPLISKVFELVAPLTPSNITFHQINPCQHGYVAGRSCVTQFIEVLESNT